MNTLKNIEEVLRYNFHKLRGGRTQHAVSEACGIPFRTFQDMESGVIPRKREYLEALARYYRVPETAFFLDPDLTEPTLEQALEVFRKLVEKVKTDTL